LVVQKLGRPAKIPPRADEQCGPPTEYEARRRFTMQVTGRKRDIPHGIYGIVPGDRPFSLAFALGVPKSAKPGEVYSFHVEHWIANRHVGGSSYEFRVTDHEREPGRKKRARAVRR
jgi:hypothetical protein